MINIMIQIKDIQTYRDGGSPAILLRNIDPVILKAFDLPDIPKQKAGHGDTCAIYEVWRNHGFVKDGKSPNHGKYFWGDINGTHIELGENHPLILRVFELLMDERKRRISAIDRFLIQ